MLILLMHNENNKVFDDLQLLCFIFVGICVIMPVTVGTTSKSLRRKEPLEYWVFNAEKRNKTHSVKANIQNLG